MKSKFRYRIARKMILKTFESISSGSLVIYEDGKEYVFKSHNPGPNAIITVHNPQAWIAVCFQGTIGSGESYMDGHWSAKSLVEVTRFFVANESMMERMEEGFANIMRRVLKGIGWIHRNTLSGSKKNIRAHYDLGNDLFKTFLDPKLMYSSALFSSEHSSLSDASVTKLQHICRKLELHSGDRVLEIGGGWGGFAIFAAENFACHVTTTTISDEQYEYTRQRIRLMGLDNKVTVLKKDYRELSGTFDKLVSIEMIEAVGHQFLDTYIKTLSERLNPKGLALIQAITIVDYRYKLAVDTVDFIKRYIFPGGFLPSIGAIMNSVGEVSDLRLLHLEDFASHYARTLSEWRQRFHSQYENILELGYDDKFIRMWDFYLAYCEGGFAERQLGLAQLIFAKPDSRVETPHLSFSLR